MLARFRGVPGLHHGTQHEPPHKVLLRRAVGLCQDVPKARGRRLFAPLEGQEIALGEVRGCQRAEQRGQPIRIGRGMDAVRERRALLREEAGHGLVRRQHEFFNQPVREQPNAPLDVLHSPGGAVHDELRFRQIEIKAPPRLTPFEQKVRQRFGVLQIRMPHRQPAAVIQRLLHAFVSEPPPRPDHARKKRRRARDAPLVEPYPCRHDQPILVGAQAAQAVGQHFGQHGLHGGREIVGVAAITGFPIQPRTRQHEMAHVRDGDPQLPCRAAGRAGKPPGIHRVVKIAGVLAVDGHERHAAQVLPFRRGCL